MTSQEFTFNTAITSIGDDGKLDENKHKTAVNRLRVPMMQVDGVRTCFIGRYEIKFTYIPEIIKPAELYERACTAIATLISQENDSDDSKELSLKLFPYRGDKVPTIVEPCWVQEQEPEPTHQAKIIAEFSTQVVAFSPSSTQSGDEDHEKFAHDTHKLASALTHLDGVVAHRISLRHAWLIIDTRYVDVETARRHMRDVLSGAKKTMDGIFPYITSDEQLVLAFRPGRSELVGAS